ncbi:MAG: Xaa-Pro peptidase family protein, partial [Proteobacteria bacterium]|nr:Xaa-Pro peptidase family protein [Pseudomonadota bacterium]
KARGWQGKTFAVETDSHHLPVWRHESIKNALPEARFVDFSRILWEMRLVKSPQETAYLREAGRIADAALLAAVDTVAPGSGERDAAAALYATAIKEGADNGRMALIAGGKRSDSLHGALGRHTLEAGDILHVEAIPAYRGYSARLMRSTAIGSPASDVADAAKRLIAIQEEQFAALRPGAVAHEVDAIVRNGVLAAGLRDRYENTTGYTIGFLGALRTSDFTRCFLPNADWLLEEGMTFHMYAWAQGMAFSDTVLITADGHERLTRVDRELFVR